MGRCEIFLNIMTSHCYRGMVFLQKWISDLLLFLLFIYLFFINLFIYLFLAVLGLRFCARAFSSCGERGPLFIAVCGPLTVMASLVVGHGLQTRRLSSCGSRASLLHGMWDLPRPGLEPVSPALAGTVSTTVPPGKPCFRYFLRIFVPTFMGDIEKLDNILMPVWFSYLAGKR